jgi:hypothetical protein
VVPVRVRVGEGGGVVHVRRGHGGWA